MVLRCFLDNDHPKTFSKGMIPLRRSLKKSKKHRAIAPAALGGCGGLGQLWEALAELSIDLYLSLLLLSRVVHNLLSYMIEP